MGGIFVAEENLNYFGGYAIREPPFPVSIRLDHGCQRLADGAWVLYA
jgi:hypothetical protein